VIASLWVAELVVSDATAQKLAGKHQLDWMDVCDAIVCVRGLRYAWHDHPVRGRRAMVEVVVGGRRCIAVLYPVGVAGSDKFALGSAYPIMTSMRAEEAERFYEEDEDAGEVRAVFDAAEKGRTAPPVSSDVERPPARLAERLRHAIASMLRQAANSIEPPGMRAR
jgi:hypothetical protein